VSDKSEKKPSIILIGSDLKMNKDVAAVLRERGANVRVSEVSYSACDLCKKVDELRPYGPNGENICFECGQKDNATTEKMMGRKLFGDE